MIPDPSTEEGRKEIKRRLRKADERCKTDVELWKSGEEVEPPGRLTDPTELDMRRDAKHDD